MQINMKALFKKIVSMALRVGISACLFVFLFSKVDVQALWQALKTIDVGLLLIAFAISLISYILCFYRWNMLLVASGMKFPFRTVLGPYLGGIFFTLSPLSTISGDAVRGLDLSLHSKKTKEVMATVLLDRLSGFVGMVFVVLIALLFGFKYISKPSFLISIFILVFILVSAVLVLFNPYIYEKINRILPTHNRITRGLKNMHQEVFSFRLNPKLLVTNLLFSVGIQSIAPLVSYLLSLALHVKISFVYFLVLLPIIGAISMLPISVAGLGVRENSFRLFFSKVGVSHDVATAMGILNSAFVLITGIAAGIAYLFLHVSTLRSRRL